MPNSSKNIPNSSKTGNNIELKIRISYNLDNTSGGVTLLNYLSEFIADFYIKRGIIKSERKELYKAGIELVLNEILTFSLVLILAGLLSSFICGIIFLVTFCFTRVYSGGYHARTTFVCRTSMLLTFTLALGISYCMRGSTIVTNLVILIVSGVILFPIIPVKHPNKELSDTQKKEGKIKGICLYILFSLVSLTLFMFHQQYSVMIALSLAAVTALAIIGIFTNCRKGGLS